MNKSYRGLRYTIRQLIGSTELFTPYLRIKEPHNVHRLVNESTNLCIAGPPRSANTFAYKVFQLWNPNCMIAHHIHMPVQVLLATKLGIPCLVLLRDPVDVALSRFIAGRLPSNVVIWSYINFYDKISKVRDKVVVGKFEDVINHFNKVVERINQKYKTDFYSNLLTKDHRNKIFMDIKNDPDRENPLMIAIPDAEKEKRKVANREKILNHPRISIAHSVFEDWLSHSNL